MINTLSSLFPPRSHLLALLLALLAATTAEAAMPEALTYRGILKYEATGKELKPGIYPITFSVYDSLRPETLLWQRTIPVNVASNGVFYTELSDTASVPTVLTGVKLADALASTKGVPEIGLRLGRDLKDEEMKPRQRLTTSVRAARAARTRIADRFVAERGVQFSALQTEALAASQLSVARRLTLGGRCTLTTCPERTLGGENSELTVCGVRTWRDPGNVRESMVDSYVIGSAPHDMVLTYEDRGETYTVIVPRGGRITAEPGTVNSVVGATEFGK